MVKFKFPKFGGSKTNGDTFLLHFVRKNVCKRKAPIGDLLLPLTPGFLMIDITQPASFVFIWTIVLLVFLIIWKIVPCNLNLNCNYKRKKDGTKALLMSFLIVYAILFGVAVMARLFICSDGVHHDSLLDKNGGLIDNIASLFTRVPIEEKLKNKLPSSILKAQEKIANQGYSTVYKDEGKSIFQKFNPIHFK